MHGTAAARWLILGLTLLSTACCGRAVRLAHVDGLLAELEELDRAIARPLEDPELPRRLRASLLDLGFQIQALRVTGGLLAMQPCPETEDIHWLEQHVITLEVRAIALEPFLQ